MLISSRYEKESIECTIDISSYINNQSLDNEIPIIIYVREVKGGQVRIGIEAPESVSIRRSEIIHT
ncbi:MAG: carbon storage regulator [Sulfuriflexus sp.]|nr:carbon storage regulator [Sulfuriflexus sp.]